MSNKPSAATRVFAVQELLEQIVSHMRPIDAFVLQRVSKGWQTAFWLDNNSHLRERMFLKAAKPKTVWPLGDVKIVWEWYGRSRVTFLFEYQPIQEATANEDFAIELSLNPGIFGKYVRGWESESVHIPHITRVKTRPEAGALCLPANRKKPDSRLDMFLTQPPIKVVYVKTFTPRNARTRGVDKMVHSATGVTLRDVAISLEKVALLAGFAEGVAEIDLAADGGLPLPEELLHVQPFHGPSRGRQPGLMGNADTLAVFVEDDDEAEKVKGRGVFLPTDEDRRTVDNLKK